MIERQPYLPRFMAGGDTNPLGARALYLGNTLYRIHGTNQPSTIGTFVSSGCIRLTNEDIADLYSRVSFGTRVVVLPGAAPRLHSGRSRASAECARKNAGTDRRAVIGNRFRRRAFVICDWIFTNSFNVAVCDLACGHVRVAWPK